MRLTYQRERERQAVGKRGSRGQERERDRETTKPRRRKPFFFEFGHKPRNIWVLKTGRTVSGFTGTMKEIRIRLKP